MKEALKSSWAWFGVLYFVILVTAYGAVINNGINPFAEEVRFTALASLLVLAYPAYRFGTLGARFFRQRDGEGVQEKPSKRQSRKYVSPNSLESRMEARRQRVEKARREGKL